MFSTIEQLPKVKNRHKPQTPLDGDVKVMINLTCFAPGLKGKASQPAQEADQASILTVSC